MNPIYTLTPISQRGKLLLRISQNGKVISTKTIGTPVLPSELENPSTAIEAIISGWNDRFKKAVYESELTGRNVVDIMFPKQEKVSEIEPYAYFLNAARYDTKVKDFSKYISKDTKWEEFTDKFIEDYSTYLEEEDFSENSQRTYMSGVKVALDKARRDGIEFPSKDYANTLRGKVGTTTSIYLNRKELELLSQVACESDLELSVKTKFLVGAWTGARFSDYKSLCEFNIIEDEYEDGDGGQVRVRSIRYVSEKTNTASTIPLKPFVEELLRQDCCEVTNSQMNRILPALARRAGINSNVTIMKADKNISGEKWEFVRTHTARKSFATNLYILGCPIRNIANYLGHKSTETTNRNYICCGPVYDDRFINGFFK